jgi:hypothetical protein
MRSEGRLRGTTRPATHPRRVTALATLTVLLVASALAACTGEASSGPDPAPSSAPPGAVLREPVPGVVEVDGAGDLVERGPAGVTVSRGEGDDDRAFARLCAGEVDLVDSVRPITAEEERACADRGLEVRSFPLGVRAVVLAIADGTDVGSDCLTTAQVRELLASGEPPPTWADLGAGFDTVVLRTAGPAVDKPVAATLGRLVFGTSDLADDDLRAGYLANPDEDGTRWFVTGPDDARREVADLASVEQLHDSLKAEVQAAWASWAAAEEEVRAAEGALQRVLAGPSSGAERTAAQERLAEARTRLADVVVVRDRARAAYQPVLARYQDLSAKQADLLRRTGNVGLFGPGFYLARTDRLHAFEVSTGADGGCVPPTTTTLLDGSYPLSEQVVLTGTVPALDRPEVQAVLADRLAAVEQAGERPDDTGLLPGPPADLDRLTAWLAGDETVAAEPVTPDPTVPAGPAETPAL